MCLDLFKWELYTIIRMLVKQTSLFNLSAPSLVVLYISEETKFNRK